jgi:hypothetical protein
VSATGPQAGNAQPGTGGTHDPVTREEIAEAIRTCFTNGQVRRTDLLLAVHERNGRPELVETIERLPDRTFRQVRDLWIVLPEIPLRTDHGRSTTVADNG